MISDCKNKYQPSGKGGTRSPPAKSKMAARGQLSQNKFFDPSTPSMRKGCDGGEKKLRDVLQEHEGTSLNYFKVYFNYIEQISRPILLYLYS